LLALAPDSRSVPGAPTASSLLTSSYPAMAVAVAGAALLCLQHGDGDGDGATPAPGNALAPPAAFPSAAAIAAVTNAGTESADAGGKGATRQTDRERELVDRSPPPPYLGQQLRGLVVVRERDSLCSPCCLFFSSFD
jgi:hypothetical protein